MNEQLVREAIALLQRAVGGTASGNTNDVRPAARVDADGIYRPAYLAEVRAKVFDKYPSGYTVAGGVNGPIDPRTGFPTQQLSERIDLPTGFLWANAEGLTDTQKFTVESNLAEQAFTMLGGPWGVNCFEYTEGRNWLGMRSRVQGKRLEGIWVVNTPSYSMLTTPRALEKYYREWVSNRFNVEV